MQGCARILLLVSLTLLTCCSREKVPDERILFKNDSSDREYNRMNVSASGLDVTLKPGEYVILPRNTTRFSVSRAYKDYTRRYTVECPPVEGSGIRIKMIDIHVNRIAGDCKTTTASKN